MIGAAIKKDVRLLLRDRGALISLFALPIIFMIVFGSIFKVGGGGSGRDIDVPIQFADGDRRGEQIVRTLDEAPGFTPVRVSAADEVRARVASEGARAGLVVPPAGPIELVIDLSAPLQVRAPVEQSLTAHVIRALFPLAAEMTSVVQSKSPPGLAAPVETPSSFQLTVPGNAVLFGFFIALTTAMAFLGERKTGTWRRLLAAPVRRSTALLATLVPYFLVGCCQLAFLFGVGVLAFGMKVAGSVVALIVLSLAVVWCAVALGLLFASVASTEKQLGGIGSVVLLVMGMLGGAMIPRIAMPPFMKSLGLGIPHSWALDGYYAVLVREGTGLADVAPSVFALFAFGVGFAALGLALFKFE
ncbi:MAG: ABC transporter permease [Myxococcales bacterium]|nr:ABC transporter permease [Myxococcales bacterium]